MDLNPDYSDLLRNLNDAGVRYLVVGAYVLGHLGNTRFTKDLDVWVEPTPENAERVWRALCAFGGHIQGVKSDDFARRDTIFQMGVPNNRIDIITEISGVDFTDAWANRTETRFGSIPVSLLSPEDLIRNKIAAGRPKDMSDVAWIRRHALSRKPAKKKTRRRK